jgi:hypothetical protein
MERLRHNGYTSSGAHNLDTSGCLFVLFGVSYSFSPFAKIKPSPQTEASENGSANVAGIDPVGGVKDCTEGKGEAK